MSDITGDENIEISKYIMPTQISEEMMRFAKPNMGQLWHWASNLNAMLRHGYCRKCGLVPDDCKRYGCLGKIG